MKSLIKLLAGGLVALSCTAGIAAVPADLVSAKYSVFASDQNGDGCTDYLVKSPDAIVPIDLDDVFVPIPVPSKSLPFMLQSSTGCTYALVQGLTRAQVTSGAWKKADYQAVVGDVKGDGGGSLLLAPTVSNTPPTFNVTRSPTTREFALAQTLKSGDFQTGIPGTTIGLELTNKDQRTDMVVRRDGQVVGVYAADVNGKFYPSSSVNKIAMSQAVWNTFLDQMKANDVEGVLKYAISTRFQAEARSILTAPGADLRRFATTLLPEFEVIEVGTIYTRAVLILTENGQKQMYFIIFAADSDGSWKIANM